jgi:hypothetical protein
VSDQKLEQSSGEAGSPNAGPAISRSPDVQSGPVAASELGSTDSHLIAPDHEAPKADAPRAEAPKTEAPKVEAAEPAASRAGGKLMIMSPGDRSFDGNESDAKTESERASGMFGKRRAAALAAVVVLAAVAGAIGGAMATVGYAHFVGSDVASTGSTALEAFVARIDNDILSLRVSVEHISKMGMVQFNKTSDRLDKVEKAQAEPAAKLAKLSEAVDKLRAAPPAAPVPVAAVAPVAPKEVTGSIAPPAAAPAAAPKVEVARLPAVEGWVLRDVGYGGALIESRRGTFEVYAGDMIPGLGRIDAIRRQDGHWVVVTSKGLVVAR